GTVCVVGKIRDLILQLSKSSIYSTKPIQFAFCDELKAYVTGFVRSGNTYTANGAAEMIKEIVANIKSDDLEILFRMDSGYFDEKIIETIESLGCKYLIKAKSYSTLTSQATNSSI
ncbi:transposase, partial [Klebsiella pneumoniae]|uniref:transposase n=1 Tax=Klebsiella pneumoniae TaxID=573 RepID=UPI003A7F8BFB